MIGGKKEPFKPPSLINVTPKPVATLPATTKLPTQPAPSRPPVTKESQGSNNMNITEEELDDENSVRDGSYLNGKQALPSNKPSS
jgi:hypothetical protein